VATPVRSGTQQTFPNPADLRGLLDAARGERILVEINGAQVIPWDLADGLEGQTLRMVVWNGSTGRLGAPPANVQMVGGGWPVVGNGQIGTVTFGWDTQILAWVESARSVI
jgi:hypothetical protein